MNRYVIASLTAAFLSSLSTWAGVDSSGGSDIPNWDTGAAWFTGERAVKYCIEVSADFGVPADEAKATVRAALAEWRNYLTERGAHSTARSERAGMLFLNTEEQPTCDTSTDLRFYLGVTNAETAQAAAAFDQPLAFAHRNSYDRNAGWGRGFLWVTKRGGIQREYPGRTDMQTFPAWRPGSLKASLLHELGHVLGCGHVPGTIMDAEFASMLRYVESGQTGWTNASLTIAQIDGMRVLYTAYADGLFFTGSPSTEESQAFRLLTGRDAVGPITSRVELQLTDPHHPTFQWTVTDALGTQSFGAELVRTTTGDSDRSFVNSPVGEHVFATSLPTARSAQISYAWSAPLTVRNSADQVIMAVAAFNDHAPLTLDILHEGRVLRAFQSTYNIGHVTR